VTDTEALAWLEGGILLESAGRAGEAFERAAAALRVKAQLVEALERVGCQSNLQPCDTPPMKPCVVCAALKAAKETP
jgi:hypothetical protein